MGLQLSGHTHGGQIWPFHAFVRLAQPIVAGFSNVGDVPVFVTRGAGFWGPPDAPLRALRDSRPRAPRGVGLNLSERGAAPRRRSSVQRREMSVSRSSGGRSVLRMRSRCATSRCAAVSEADHAAIRRRVESGVASVSFPA